MRKIDYIIIHCSATRCTENFTAKDIDAWHKQRGWHCIGYHFVIDLDGTVELGRAVRDVGAHVYGYNKNSIGICYIGGLDRYGNPADTRTPEQRKALRILVNHMKTTFPGAKVVGHRDLSPDVNGDGIIEKWEWLKECPCFDVSKDL